MNDTNALLPHVKLHFNILHPSHEESYVYGYECAIGEIGEDANPYKAGTKASEYWLEGWWDGFYGEKPVFSIDENTTTCTNQVVKPAVNDDDYHHSIDNFFIKLLEISGVIAVSAIVGYQLIELVA